MSSKLFLVCPFSCMEPFIRKKFGNNIFFITSMATESQFHNIPYLEFVKNTIACENISQIFIVNDTSCRFINGILTGKKSLGTAAEENIQNVFINNYSLIMRQPSIADKAKTLAALNIKQQALEIWQNELFKRQIIQQNIHIRGLITNKSQNKIIEIALNRSEC